MEVTSIIQLLMQHSLFISTKWNAIWYNPFHCISCSRIAHGSIMLMWWSENPRPFIARLFYLRKVTHSPSRSRCGVRSLHSGWLLEELDRHFINPPDRPNGGELQRAGLHSGSWRHQRTEPKRTRCHLHEPRWAAESSAAELCSRYGGRGIPDPWPKGCSRGTH